MILAGLFNYTPALKQQNAFVNFSPSVQVQCSCCINQNLLLAIGSFIFIGCVRSCGVASTL